MGGTPDPAPPPMGVRPNKSARPRNTAVTTAAAGKMRSHCLYSVVLYTSMQLMFMPGDFRRSLRLTNIINVKCISLNDQIESFYLNRSMRNG